MSKDIVIDVKNLSKCHHIYEKPGDRLKQMLFRGRKKLYREFWAVKDVSFEIKKGETVGIVGQNGSGKSTLLQLICGTLNPTSGSVNVSGRISALLELGSGFNPEFTGKENVYLNASILGLNKEEIDARYNEMLAFADIGDFIDQPVKTYSSGMLMRLAFSVSINVDPDILVIDEALAVGDDLFQRKCFSRLEFMKDSGVTILFVSHSASQVITLCDRAILIDKGNLLAINEPKFIVNKYHRMIYAPAELRAEIRDELLDSSQDLIADFSPKEFYDENFNPSSRVEYVSQGAFIHDISIKNMSNTPVNFLLSGNLYKYTYKVKFDVDANNVRFGMLIKTISGIELGGAVSGDKEPNELLFLKKNTLVNVEIIFRAALNSGTYFLNAGVTARLNEEVHYLHRVLDAVSFKINSNNNVYSTGLVDFDCSPVISLNIND
jgi:lipopolysaccharide transport system ATP-binding protein